MLKKIAYETRAALRPPDFLLELDLIERAPKQSTKIVSMNVNVSAQECKKLVERVRVAWQNCELNYVPKWVKYTSQRMRSLSKLLRQTGVTAPKRYKYLWTSQMSSAEIEKLIQKR